MLRQIAPEPIEFAPAESDSAWRRLSAWAMPWLLSSSVHLVMLVSLAITWHLSTEHSGGGSDWAGLSSGMSLKAVMTGSGGDANAERGHEEHRQHAVHQFGRDIHEQRCQTERPDRARQASPVHG